MMGCSFELNGKPMSTFTFNSKSFSAFSGLGNSINDPSATCHKDAGPIPRGSYYIVDRQSGGRLGFLYDRLSGKKDWFALYAEDSHVDDFSDWCEGLLRGEFRLHPKVGVGISRGCIVIEQLSDFKVIEATLRARQPTPIPGTELCAWAKVTVK